jgi:hypothetical protein
MTAITVPTTTLPTTLTTPARPAINRTVKAEWTKVRTLRSTWRSVGVAVVVTISLGAALVQSQVSSWDSMTPAQRSAFDPTSTAMIGLLFAAVILGALAVRTMTAEYATGMIRTTFAALPARRGVLAAKAAVMAALAFPVALVCDFVSFEIGQHILSAKHAEVTLGHPGVVEAIVFGAFALSLTAVVGVGLGGLLRRTAPATTALSLVLIGGAVLGQFVPAGVRQFLPESVVQATVTVHHSAGLLHPGIALGLLAAYAAVVLAAAAVRINSRDA